MIHSEHSKGLEHKFLTDASCEHHPAITIIEAS